jgi:hypothetical protein
MLMANEYWLTKPGNEIITEISKRVVSFDKYLQSSGVMSQLRDSYATYYGDTEIRDAGSHGELKAIRINHYASLIRNIISMVTTQKIAFNSIAANTDSESQAAAILSTGLLDFYLKENRLDRVFKNAALQASFLKESWVSPTWDTQKGNIIHVGDPENGIPPIHEGDLKFESFLLTNVIRDLNRTDNQHDWLIARSYINRYDLSAQFPEYAEEINNVKIDKVNQNNLTFRRIDNQSEDDSIPYFVLYCKQSPSLPNGRMIQFIDDLVLTDSALPYPKIPLIRITPEDTFEQAFGHSPMYDVLAIQKAIDSLASVLLTNNQAFGVQNIWSKKGNGLTVNQIVGGLNLIESETRPEPLNLTASSPESYKLLEMFISQGQLLSGVNDAVRGVTPSGMSGAAMALLSQQALQFANGLQQSYVSMAEDVATLSINILQKYANTTRIAALAGKNNRPLLKEWSSQDLNGVSRVSIEVGNGLSKTAAGRLQIADALMQNHMIQRPEQYIAVLETGRLEPIYEHESRQLHLIRAENENLTNGEAVRAIITDAHEQHILEHASVLASPEARGNPNSALVVNTLNHINEHLELVRTADPGLMAILKQQPLPAQQTPMPQASQGPVGSSNLNQVPQAMNGANPVETAAGNVNQPNLPRDLLHHGQRFDPSQPPTPIANNP